MRLYGRFVWISLLLACFTLGMQIVWWKRDYVYVYVYETNINADTQPFDNSSAKHPGRLLQTIPVTNSTGINETDPLFIWDSASGRDRIPEQMKHVPVNIRSGDRRPRVILVDTGPSMWGMPYGNTTFIEQGCPVRNCKLVDRLTSEKRIDAILFGDHIPTYVDALEAKYRQPNQVWIFFALESPKATDIFHSVLKHVNWTATYRRDSTMVAPYERWMPFANASSIKRTRNYAKGKTKMAAIFVSNCVTSNKRLDYAKELGKYVGVDIYGYCGNNTCPRNEQDRCFKLLNEEYKFYLAFENANCRDYITEKLFVNGLGHDVIPVVMGGHPEDYAKSAPPRSYIHVEEFKSPKELAAYMKHLDKNDELYNEYFNWKGTGTFLNTKFWCRLCALVSDDNKPKLIVENLEEWWRPKDMCRDGRWT